MKHIHTNALIHSTSPYLLQHAHNPVNWQPWSEELVSQATKENKLILVSIGYAACHWCHVMEYESFEDEQVAAVMNENFVCIKVDREERPDVDHYYMTAVQLMSRQGGWPLNVIALPDGRPIWGGTYFPKDSWVSNLKAVANFYRTNRQETEKYAADLQNGIRQVSLTAEPTTTTVKSSLLDNVVATWKERFDMQNGGRTGQPKFPMPVNLEFLLNYGYLKDDKIALDFVRVTLEKMARGGIYDQVGGGFSRYSVDAVWKVPHFEKMLYDNGQLLSIYAKGFQVFQCNEFKTVVYETTAFMEHELMDSSGAFYSSLDADSEGEEGKFYVWSKAELEEIIGEDYQLFSDYFNVNKNGSWEGNYILLRGSSDDDFARENDILLRTVQDKVKRWKKLLLDKRSKRIRPGLDDKTLTSWNTLVIIGLTDAYKAFNDPWFKELALKNGRFLAEQMMQPNGKLFHIWKKGTASVDGFLEDYTLTIRAFVLLYEDTGDEVWLEHTIKLLDYSQANFYDEEKELFYFSEKHLSSTLVNHFPTEDNVIPSGNSVMANNLYQLGLLLGKPEYLAMAKKMVRPVTAQFSNYPMAFANWGTLMLKWIEPYFEVAVCGDNSEEVCMELWKDYRPDIIFAFSTNHSEVPLLKDRFVPDKTLIYVCREGACKLPVTSISEAVELMKE
jgi:uncharacterized protein YyaL (SSP411 family)